MAGAGHADVGAASVSAVTANGYNLGAESGIMCPKPGQAEGSPGLGQELSIEKLGDSSLKGHRNASVACTDAACSY